MAENTPSSTVAPFDRVSDVNVIMTVIHPRPVTGLGNLLILNPVTPSVQQTAGKAGETTALPDELSAQDRMNGILLRKTDPSSKAIYREYKNVDAVAVDYPEKSTVWNKASTYFAQSNHSDRVAVLDYDPSKAYDALKAFWYFNWTFAIQAVSKVDQDAVTLSNIFERNQDHFLVLQTNDISEYSKLLGQNYTIGLKHDTAEAMDAALVGANGTLPVGSITWKFKELVGITTESLTSNELSDINHCKAIAYVRVNGRGETSEGWTLSGEYIDVLHGILWIKTNIQGELENFLQKNGKVPYEQRGIIQLSGVVTQVLQQAYEQGIILTNDATGKADYTVTTTSRDEQSQTDLSARHYGGLSFAYHVSGAIHTITVNGQVQSDTILVKGGNR